jgi:hypothetical protein
VDRVPIRPPASAFSIMTVGQKTKLSHIGLGMDRLKICLIDHS